MSLSPSAVRLSEIRRLHDESASVDDRADYLSHLRVIGARLLDCPPAGAPQGVNEAAVSVAAPAASGQSAGTRPSKRVLWRYRTSRAIVARELAGEVVPWSVIRQCAANVIAGYAP